VRGRGDIADGGYPKHLRRDSQAHSQISARWHLAGFERMRFALVEHIKPVIAQQIRGNATPNGSCSAALTSMIKPHILPG
jgi:hypothetical protein